MRYRGVKYRSRLEAKWAAFFHHAGWEAVYDPRGGGDPTFLVLEGGTFFVTVVPDLRRAYLLDGTLHVGLSPVESWDRAAWDKATNDLQAVA